MRCVVRIILLTCFIFVAFIYLAVSHANSKIVIAFDANGRLFSKFRYSNQLFKGAKFYKTYLELKKHRKL